MRRRTPISAAAVLALSTLVLPVTDAATGSQAAAAAPAGEVGSRWEETAYRGAPQVVPAEEGQESDTISGAVYVDADRDSVKDEGEKGLAGVAVSNGRDIDETDRWGRYELPALENMTVFVTQPRGYQVPVDDDNVAQFHYHHLPEGSPEELRYGGLEPTGPLPAAVNFGVVRSPETQAREQHCIMAGDLQTYDTDEVEYARKGAMKDMAERDDYTGCGPLFLGDVVGDDLSLYPDIRELMRDVNGPVRFLPGNHDLDYDASSDEHSFDTYKQNLGPTYYSYDVGQTHIVALDTVRYPCTPEVDNAEGLLPECADPERSPQYAGRLSEDAMTWLKADLARTPRNKLVVIASHIPLLTFADEGERRHQVAQTPEIHAMLEGRKVVAVAGHTHSIENMRTGDLYEGWNDIFGIEGLPFPHLVAGAISGDWYSGRLTDEGYPEALGRDGGVPGLTTFDITGNRFQERFTVRGESDEVQTRLALNTPTFREWMTARQEWNDDPVGPAPELGDTGVVTRDDLRRSTWLTTNFWMGSTDSQVEVSLDGEPARPARLIQPGRGEDQLVGPAYADPYAVAQQLVHGGSVADRSMHIWRFPLPAGLAAGEHTVEVEATDSYGRTFTDELRFTVTD